MSTLIHTHDQLEKLSLGLRLRYTSCFSRLKATKHREAYGSLYGGLPRSIEGNITASKPQTFEEAINIAQRLMDQIIRHNSTQDTNDHKRKFDDKNTTDNNNYPNDRNNNYQNNHNNHNHNNDHHQQQNRKKETFKTYVATNGYIGNRPLCERCTLHHIGPYSVKCQNCNKDVDLEKEEAQVEDDDDGDTYPIWDITLKDVKRIKQFFNVPDETDEVNELCGYVLWKPLRDFTRLLGPPSGLKGLFHTLNGTVIPTKPYMLCKSDGAWIVNKFRGSIANQTSWMLYV
nr:reverse transcriptase domain-containing protein [Tanacetum cinerariifolium]